MEWIIPGYDEYELSAEMTGYAGHWPAAEAEADEALDSDAGDAD